MALPPDASPRCSAAASASDSRSFAAFETRVRALLARAKGDARVSSTDDDASPRSSSRRRRRPGPRARARRDPFADALAAEAALLAPAPPPPGSSGATAPEPASALTRSALDALSRLSPAAAETILDASSPSRRVALEDGSPGDDPKRLDVARSVGAALVAAKSRGNPSSVAVAADGRVAVGTTDGVVVVCDPNTRHPRGPPLLPAAGREKNYTFRARASSDDGLLECVAMGVPTPGATVSALAFCAVASSRFEGAAAASGGSSSASFAAKASRWVLAGHRDGSALLWDASSGKCVREFRGAHATPVVACALLAPGDEPEVREGPEERVVGASQGVASLPPGPGPPPPKPSRRAPRPDERGASALALENRGGFSVEALTAALDGSTCRHVVASFGPMTRSRSASLGERTSVAQFQPLPPPRRNASTAEDGFFDGGGPGLDPNLDAAGVVALATWNDVVIMRLRPEPEVVAKVSRPAGAPRDARPCVAWAPRIPGGSRPGEGSEEERLGGRAQEGPAFFAKKIVRATPGETTRFAVSRGRVVSFHAVHALLEGTSAEGTKGSGSSSSRAATRAPATVREASLDAVLPGDVAALAWLSSGVVVASDAEGNVVAIDPDTGAVETVDSSRDRDRTTGGSTSPSPSPSPSPGDEKGTVSRGAGARARARATPPPPPLAKVAMPAPPSSRRERETSNASNVRGEKRETLAFGACGDGPLLATLTTSRDRPARFAAARSWRSRVSDALDAGDAALAVADALAAAATDEGRAEASAREATRLLPEIAAIRAGTGVEDGDDGRLGRSAAAACVAVAAAAGDVSAATAPATYDAVCARGAAAKATFLEALVPHVTAGRLTRVPPEPLRALVEHHAAVLRRPAVVERCLLRVDLDAVDLNQGARICAKHGLWSAHARLFAVALDDRMTPARAMFDAARGTRVGDDEGGSRDEGRAAEEKGSKPPGSWEKKQKRARIAATRCLLFLREAAAGRAFPPGSSGAASRDRSDRSACASIGASSIGVDRDVARAEVFGFLLGSSSGPEEAGGSSRGARLDFFLAAAPDATLRLLGETLGESEGETTRETRGFGARARWSLRSCLDAAGEPEPEPDAPSPDSAPSDATVRDQRTVALALAEGLSAYAAAEADPSSDARRARRAALRLVASLVAEGALLPPPARRSPAGSSRVAERAALLEALAASDDDAEDDASARPGPPEDENPPPEDEAHPKPPPGASTRSDKRATRSFGRGRSLETLRAVRRRERVFVAVAGVDRTGRAFGPAASDAASDALAAKALSLAVDAGFDRAAAALRAARGEHVQALVALARAAREDADAEAESASERTREEGEEREEEEREQKEKEKEKEKPSKASKASNASANQSASKASASFASYASRFLEPLRYCDALLGLGAAAAVPDAPARPLAALGGVAVLPNLLGDRFASAAKKKREASAFRAALLSRLPSLLEEDFDAAACLAAQCFPTARLQRRVAAAFFSSSSSEKKGGGSLSSGGSSSSSLESLAFAFLDVQRYATALAFAEKAARDQAEEDLAPRGPDGSMTEEEDAPSKSFVRRHAPLAPSSAFSAGASLAALRGPTAAPLAHLARLLAGVHASVGYRFAEASQESFLFLACAYAPTTLRDRLADARQAYRLEPTLARCRRYGVADAEAFLWERAGLPREAVATLLDAYASRLRSANAFRRDFEVPSEVPSEEGKRTAAATEGGARGGEDVVEDVVGDVVGDDRRRKLGDATRTLALAAGVCARAAAADAASDESRDLWRYLLRGALRAAANAPDAAAAGALGVARAAAKAAKAAAGSDANARRDLSGAPLEATRRGGNGDDELASLDLIADALRRALGAASARSGGEPRTSGTPRDRVGGEECDRRGRALGAASRSLLGGAGRLAEDVDERRRAAAARARDATRRAARAARRGRTDKRRVELVWDPPAAKID